MKRRSGSSTPSLLVSFVAHRGWEFSPQRSVWSIASLLTATSGTFAVVVLMLGLRSTSDPRSMFNAFYVFVFYFACAIWSVEQRIDAAELSAREQSLRIECRLADLAERLSK